MKSCGVWLACLAVIGVRANAQDRPPELVASTEALSPEAEKALFRLPPGFEAQLVASEPDIAKPMNLAFDELGRLWVTSSYEYPFPAKVGQPGRDKVTVLSDLGPDGRARKVVTFADGLNIPIGVLPLSPSEALVLSIPNIYHMSDTDGDGRADRREIAYSMIGFRDTHGMASAFTFGFDGWIYGCHGFANDSTLKGSDGQAIHLNSGNTYRLRPDGSHVEQFTWGQVNPFGLAFDPLGNLYSTDCHTRPIYQLLRGAYYDSFGKPHDGLGYGPEMMTHDHDSTGIAGICYYAADAFPGEYRDSIFVGNVVTSRINRDRLEWRGSSPRAVAEPDFLVSGDPWFRPVDLELGPDGALYVADFYNCIIGHYEVDLRHPRRDRERGRIWRIVYTGEGVERACAPHGGDWMNATVDALIEDLSHPNLAVRLTSARGLVKRGEGVVSALSGALEDHPTPTLHAHGLWVLEQLGRLEPERLAAAARSADRMVRVHAMRIVADGPGWDEHRRGLALDGLKDDDPLVRRCAAEALGLHPNAEHVGALLSARRQVDPTDTHLLHVVRMALRNQFREAAVWPSPADAANLDHKDLRALADIAPGVPTIAAARFLIGYLERFEEPLDVVTRYEQHVARRGDIETDKQLIEWARRHDERSLVSQAAQLRAIQQGWQQRGIGLSDEAANWASQVVTSMLEAEDHGVRAAGAELAGVLRLGTVFGQLEACALEPQTPELVRRKALASLLGIDPGRAVGALVRVADDGSVSIGVREHAAGLLGQSGRAEARAALLDAMKEAPARLQTSMALAVASTREGAQALLDAIESGKASAHLLQARPVEIRLRELGIERIDARLAELSRDLPSSNELMQNLIARRLTAFENAQRSAAATRGAEVFSKTCAACHQLAGVGGRVGPQLDGVGVRGAERLMEDLLDPNRNVDQAFRASTLALTDGRVVSGLVLREEGETLVLADAEGKEHVFAQAEIEERRITPLSPMPANLADQVDEEAFQDLIAFLLTQRAAPPQAGRE